MRTKEPLQAMSGIGSRSATTSVGHPEIGAGSLDSEGSRNPPRPMYGEFYALQEPPFDLTPNPKFLFLTARQREALSNLYYGLATHKGLTLLIGEAGTGKTTLVRTALSRLGDTPNRYILVSNPTLRRREFYEYLASEFGFGAEASASKTKFLSALKLELEGRFLAGGLTGLIVDEAQSLPDELLEEIRLLGNLETSTAKLLNIVLSGQPELADRLNQPSLRQLKQRVSLRCELTVLGIDETAAYISGRLRIAGATPAEVFTREAVLAIHEASGGIPRMINVLCDNALIGGFAAQVKPITVDIVAEVCRDFELGEVSTNDDVGGEGRRASPSSVRKARPTAHTAEGGGTGASRVERAMFGSVYPGRKRKFIFF